MHFVKFFVVILASSIHMVSSQNIFVNLINKCEFSSKPLLNSCLSNVFESIKPFLHEGIPSLNIPVLDPVNLRKFSFNHRTGPVNIEGKFRDVFVTGFSNFSLKGLDTDLQTRQLVVRVHIPEMRVTGNYDLGGNILLLQVTGNGPFGMRLTNVDSEMKSNIVIKNENGVERLGVANTVINFKLGKARSKFLNLFNGDKVLGDTLNHFINSNSMIIIDEIKPAISKQLGEFIEIIMDAALGMIPVDVIIRSRRTTT